MNDAARCVAACEHSPALSPQVRRKDERSDAYKFAQLSPCMFSRCVGLFWFLLALGACVGAIVAGVILPADNGVGKEDGPACNGCLAWWRLIPAVGVLGGCIVVAVVAVLVYGRRGGLTAVGSPLAV